MPLPIERLWKVKTAFFTGSNQIVEVLMRQGAELSRREIKELPPEALPQLVEELIKGMMRAWGSFHPQGQRHRYVWQEICDIHGWDDSSINQEQEALLERLRFYFLEKLSGCRTIDEISSRDLRLRLGDWVEADDIAEREVALDEFCQQQEEREAMYAEQSLLTQEKEAIRRREREAAIASLTAQEEELRRRIGAIALKAPPKIRKLITDIRWQLSASYSNVADISKKVVELRAAVNECERANQERFELTVRAREVALSQFPFCPLCGHSWTEQGNNRLICTGRPDLNRILRIKDEYSFDLGQFLTDNDELAGRLLISPQNGQVELSFTMDRDRPWTGKKFKQVRYVAQAAILPTELVDQREQIIADLHELQEARRELEALTARLREIEQRVGAGAVKRLTFRIRGGRAVADDGRTTYVADYRDPYPNDGETWFCEIVSPPSTSPLRGVVAIPILKAGSIASSEDLDELRRLVAESYPGLPEEVLVH